MTMENVHSEMYCLLIDTYITDAAEKNYLLKGIEEIESVKCKAEWALKWIDSSKPFEERLIAFAVVEGIFFSASFCVIFWMNSRGLLPVLSSSNEFIARDEGLHVEFACLLYTKYVQNKASHERVKQIVDEAV